MDEELTNVGLQVQAMDEGVKTGFARVDKDLEALDQRIDRRRDQCERTENILQAAEHKIECLEERHRDYLAMIMELRVKVQSMESQLCHCGKGKGKEREVLGEVTSLLGSPLVLDRDVEERTASDSSYHTPPTASSYLDPSSSSGQSDQENLVVLYDSNLSSRLVEVDEDPAENDTCIPVPQPSIDVDGIQRLMAVRGQRAKRSQGRPNSAFHPYNFACRLGSRSSTHRPSSLCLRCPTSG